MMQIVWKIREGLVLSKELLKPRMLLWRHKGGAEDAHCWINEEKHEDAANPRSCLVNQMKILHLMLECVGPGNSSPFGGGGHQRLAKLLRNKFLPWMQEISPSSWFSL